MGHRVSHIALGAIVVVTPFGAWTSDALAQTYSITSFTSTGSAGTLVAGSSATTVTLSPSGSFTPAVNAMHSPSLVYTVAVKCVDGSGSSRRCTSHDMVMVMKDTSSTSSGRLGPLTSFTIGSGTSQSVLSTTTSGTNPTTYTLTLGTLTNGGTNSLKVGFGIPVLTSGSTGVGATRTFSLAVGIAGTLGSAQTKTVVATVWNPLSVGSTTNLSFGKVTAPQTGIATYSLTPTGTMTATGGAFFPASTHSVATFGVTGEGDQDFSLTVPASLYLVTGGHTLTVSTTPSYGASGLTSQTFSKTLGTLGSFAFTVGGTLPVSAVPSGTYTGNLIVSVQYN